MEPVIDVSSKLIRQLPLVPRAFSPSFPARSLLFYTPHTQRSVGFAVCGPARSLAAAAGNKLTCWLTGGRGRRAGDGRPALFKMCSGVPEVENRTLAERKIAISYGLKRCIAPPHSLTPWLPITWQCPQRRSWFAGQM